MKKCTIILMVVLTIVACEKKEKVDSPATKNSENDVVTKCDSLTLDDYNKISNIIEKKEWLKKHGDSVCRKILDSTVLVVHEVKGEVSDKKGTYDISWGKLKKKIASHGYDRYLSVEYNEDTITGVKLVKKYEEGSYCFSTALIRSLAKKYAKGDDNAKFQFSLAKVNNKSKRSMETVVVIQVNGAPYYYDYSTEPPFISTDNMPL